jgi:hypothetical protein
MQRKEGNLEDFMYNRIISLDCEGLRNKMKEEKDDWDFHDEGPEVGGLDAEDKYNGNIEMWSLLYSILQIPTMVTTMLL